MVPARVRSFYQATMGSSPIIECSYYTSRLLGCQISNRHIGFLSTKPFSTATMDRPLPILHVESPLHFYAPMPHYKQAPGHFSAHVRHAYRRAIAITCSTIGLQHQAKLTDRTVILCFRATQQLNCTCQSFSQSRHDLRAGRVNRFPSS